MDAPFDQNTINQLMINQKLSPHRALIEAIWTYADQALLKALPAVQARKHVNSNVKAILATRQYRQALGA